VLLEPSYRDPEDLFEERAERLADEYGLKIADARLALEEIRKDDEADAAYWSAYQRGDMQ
jgi:hypothetical protein